MKMTRTSAFHRYFTWITLVSVGLFYLEPLAAMESTSSQSTDFESLADKNNPFFPIELFYNPKTNEVSQAIKDLLELTGIKVKDYQLETVTNAIQGKSHPEQSWLRTGERWKITSKLAEEVGEKIVSIILNDLKFGEEIYPNNPSTAEGFVLFGSSLKTVRQRVAFLNALVREKSIPIKPIYLLGGERPLSAEQEETKDSIFDADNGIVTFRPNYNIPKLLPIINDERDMIAIVADQSIDEQWQSEITSLPTPKEGSAPRATTETTLKTLLSNPDLKKGHYIAISEAPFIEYQQVVTNRTLMMSGKNHDHTIEVVGRGTKSNAHDKQFSKSQQAGVLLDTVARIFYELCLIKKLSLKAKQN